MGVITSYADAGSMDDSSKVLGIDDASTTKLFTGAEIKAYVLSAGNVGTTALASKAVTSAKLDDSVNPEVRGGENSFNYIASGCVWTADSAGTNTKASMTSGVVYINGKRLTVAAVTSRTFTASKDTYVDFADNGDGTAKIIYTTATNNTSSPSTLSDSSTFADSTNIRNAIIVTGSASIANSGSINQGDPTCVLPIASSIPYAVTDTLGNLICPRDPYRKLLGVRQVISSQGSITGAVDITGLSVPFIAPANRKVKITLSGADVKSTVAGDTCTINIKEGSTSLQGTDFGLPTASIHQNCQPLSVVLLPSAGLHTYKGTIVRAAGSGTLTLDASSSIPLQLLVELY